MTRRRTHRTQRVFHIPFRQLATRSGTDGGFTLIEVIIVIVIAGILASVAMRSVASLADTARIEETKDEMIMIAQSIVGNPDLNNNGTRTDFGYVGDVGSMPPNLDALINNPGGYATWNGPYAQNRFSQISSDIKQDAWGANYSYSGGNTITSSGSGSDIVLKVGRVVSDFTLNRVSGKILDRDGTPPPPLYNDSISVRLVFPDGAGGYTAKSVTVIHGGYFAFDSIPIGNHDLEIVYGPLSDTIQNFVSVLPGRDTHGDYLLTTNVWYDTSGGSLEFVAASDTVYSNPQCNNFSFWIVNNTGAPITIDWMIFSWASPTAYYKSIEWNGATVFDQPNPSNGSGDTAVFSPPQVINDGQTAKLSGLAFKTQPFGGPMVDMSGATTTIELSDGSSFVINFGACL